MTKQGHKGFFIDDWWVSPPEGILTRGNETARLEPKAMEVLVYLASHPGEVITREELEREVWLGALVGYDAVTNTVIKLRKALHDDARQPRFIATIPKKGYQLIASITSADGGKNSETRSPVSSEPVASSEPGKPSWSVQKIGMVIAVLAGIVAVGLLWSWPSAPAPDEQDKSGNSNFVAALPSIVVLPFINLSHDQKQDYLADGITEDIITDLSRISNMLVIASSTSSSYKGKNTPLKEIGKTLNVSYVLKGSIRQLDNAIRVNAQLVNAETGFNLWAQRYDRKINEVFAVQDEVTNSIAKALTIKLTNQERRRLAQRTTDNLKAYDFFQEGLKISRVSTKEANEQAREAYRKAIELDPSYGRAYGAMAFTLATDSRRGWTDSPLWTLDRALELAEQAVALDDTTPQTHWVLSYVYIFRKEFDNAEKAAEQAISIAPSYADGYGLLALISNYVAQPKRAIELNNKAMRLNPHYTFEYLHINGMAYYMLGDYDKAIATLEEARARNENAIHVKLTLAASYVRAGRQEEAEWVADELLILSPTATIKGLEKTVPFANPEHTRAFIDDLRKAGLPE